MTKITTLFFDVGDVILTNGWDRPARLRAAEHFDLDWDEFESVTNWWSPTSKLAA